MPANRAEAALLLDLDGTLVDTAPDLHRAANRLRARHGLGELPFERFRPTVSRGARAMLELCFPELDGQAREALLEPFLALYRDDLCRDSGLFAGMEGVLEGLAERRVPWGIVTNKPRFLAEPLLAALGLDGRAAVMLCGDCLPVRKPDPAPVLAACAALGVAPESVWFVGDDERDVQAGRAARCRTAIATWGYVPEPEVYRAWGGDRILARPAELLELFAEG